MEANIILTDGQSGGTFYKKFIKSRKQKNKDKE